MRLLAFFSAAAILASTLWTAPPASADPSPGVTGILKEDYVEANGSIGGYPGGKSITREEFFATKADIFAPCALENQIGEGDLGVMPFRAGETLRWRLD